MLITVINVARYVLKRIALGAVVLAVASLGATPLSQSTLRMSFTPGQLDGETKVWQFAQASNGQVIAGGERVFYYEGGNWKFLPGLRKPAIRSLLVDEDTLWIASLNDLSWVALPLNASSQPTSLAVPGLAEAGDFWHLAKSGDNLVAVATDEVWIINPRTHATNRTKLPGKYRLSLVKLGDKLIVAHPGVGLWEVKDGQLQPFANPLPARAEVTTGDRPDSYWLWADADHLVTSLALYQRGKDGYRPVIDFRALNRAIIPTLSAWNGSIVLATYTKGIMLLDPATGTTTPFGPAVPVLGCTTSFVDASDRLWVGNTQGIMLFESPRFGRVITSAPNPVSAARAKGIFINYEDHSTYHRVDGREVEMGRVFGLIPTTHGPAVGFWGKVKVDEKEFLTPGNSVEVILELPGGNLLAASGETLYYLDYERGSSVPVDGIKANFSGLSVAKDFIWATTFDRGLYRSRLKPPFTFERIGQIPETHATSIKSLGNIPVVVSNHRVLYGPRFAPVEHTTGLRQPYLADEDGVLWLTGKQDGIQRLGRLRESNGTVSWEIVEAKGLPLLSEVHSLSANEGVLTFCGESTILELETKALTARYRLSAPPLLFSVEASRDGKEEWAASPPAEIPPRSNRLTFTGSPSFDEFGEKPGFEHRLLPTESTWTPTKRGEVVTYPSLSAQHYTLEVRATHLGQSGPAAAYPFDVLPPWYASRFAIAGYILCSGLAGYGAYRLRTRQIRQRNHELETLIQARTRDLARASAAKTEFLASMSHEIRNPMNGVVGLVTILRDQSAGNARVAHTLKMLSHCAEQLRSTVDDILDFSKIEAGELAMEKVRFNLLETLGASMATIDPSETQITFLESPPEGLILEGDAAKLRQIFANYLSNALKYGVPPGARVSTILTPAAAGLQLTLSVISSGPSIDKDTLDKFFDSFTRGDEAKEKNIRGTGLGLAICRRYARAMGGEVGAVSTNGETTFYLTVPFAQVSAAAIFAPAAIPPLALPAKALAIEDEDYNRVVLGSILAKMNYTVDWAPNGKEALQLAREHGYDIILTDYRLPDTNGVDLTREILRICPDPKPAVFAVTAYSTKERKEECLAAGMAGFISKPITLEKLQQALAGWGEKHLSKISLEASRPSVAPRLPGSIEQAWGELLQTSQRDPRQAAGLAHRLNNLCRSHYYFDLAEQLELLEGALERGEPPGKLIQAIERLLRPRDLADQPS